MRYALGALKGVGERAMDEMCAERCAGGPFRNLEDFADRIDPRLLNRRQLESLAAGGAFEELGHDRATIFAAAETILAHANAAAAARISGQGGLFGGDMAADVPPIRLPTGQHWSMAETMAAEKEAFGFYFSAHPTDSYRHLAQAHGCRSFTEWCAMPAPPAPEPDERGRRQPAPTVSMAALIEDARWRTSARGNRYLMVACSDASGQFQASCFDDEVSVRIEEAAKAGGCGLLIGRARPQARRRDAARHDPQHPPVRGHDDGDAAAARRHARRSGGGGGAGGRARGVARRAGRTPPVRALPDGDTAHLSPGATICSMPRWCSGSRSCRAWRAARLAPVEGPRLALGGVGGGG